MAIKNILSLSRGIAGVVGGWVLGQILSFPLAFIIDLIAGQEVTGGRWPVTFPNIVWVCLTAVIAGFFAGWISGAWGKFAGALTQFVPVFALILIVIWRNVDPNDYIEKNYDSNPAMWAWIGLLPAMLGGHFGAKMGYKIFYYAVAGIGGLTMMGWWFGGLALHVFTIVIAYHMSGLGSAVLTFVFPLFSEIYWFFKIWNDSGNLINYYSVWVFTLLFFLLAGGGCLLIAGKMEERKEDTLE